MGIKNLSKLISRIAPGAKRETRLSDYANMRLAIDVPIYMWKFCSITCGRPLRCFEDQIRDFRSLNISPVYVFDGAAVASKQNEVERRRVIRSNTRTAMTSAQSAYQDLRVQERSTRAYHRELEQAKQHYDRLRRRVQSMPCRRHYDGLRDMLRSLDIPVVEAEGDAERRCAELVGAGEADCVVTDDYDAVPYLCGLAGGEGRMLFGLNRPTILEINVARLLEESEMSRSELVDVCILSGCDFCDKIQGVACNRAFQLVKQHGTIENIVANLDVTRFTVPDPFDYAVARVQFGVE